VFGWFYIFRENVLHEFLYLKHLYTTQQLSTYFTTSDYLTEAFYLLFVLLSFFFAKCQEFTNCHIYANNESFDFIGRAKWVFWGREKGGRGGKGRMKITWYRVFWRFGYSDSGLCIIFTYERHKKRRLISETFFYPHIYRFWSTSLSCRNIFWLVVKKSGELSTFVYHYFFFRTPFRVH